MIKKYKYKYLDKAKIWVYLFTINPEVSIEINVVKDRLILVNLDKVIID